MKQLSPFGMSSSDYQSPHAAIDATYIDNRGIPVPTRLDVPENMHVQQLKEAKILLDLGCGIGRNLAWIMENTEAFYLGLDPNPSMLRHFWQVQDKKYLDRVHLCANFEQVDQCLVDERIDYVVSTFVLQHLTTKLVPGGSMNRVDITREVIKRCYPGAPWFCFESEYEEEWINQWATDCNIVPVVYRNYRGLPELTHRENFNPATHHHLIIFRS